VPGGITGPPWGPGAPGLGVSRIGTIKYGLESRGTQTREGLRWQGQAATVNYRPILSSERASQNNKPQLPKENFKKKEKLVMGPDCDLPPGETGRLTVGRKITLTLIRLWLLTVTLSWISLFMGDMGEGALHRDDRRQLSNNGN
jgi:hypothetical protein